MKTRSLFAAAALAALAAAVALPAAYAQDKMGGGKMDHMKGGKMGHMDKMGGGKMAAKTVYACAECKMYYAGADAKKMGMKDAMGHKLTPMAMAKVPKGYKMGGGKMDHMGGGKMDHTGGKMAPAAKP
jgi:hypothetical protein